MKIAFFEVNDWEIPIIKERLKDHELDFYLWPLKNDDILLVKNVEVISTFIYSKLDKKTLEKLPRLKLIVTRSTGFNHIDLKECKKRKITVCNVPSYGENTVAEHTFALILDLSRNIHKAFVRVVRDDFSIKGLQGFDLKNKTLGVIGAGHIGIHVIRIAKGFEMNVLAYDKFIKKSMASKLKFKYVPLKTLLKNSDIVSLHVPLTKDTYHLINKNTIKLMKRGAILINTSRGEIVETKALLDAINSGYLKGAGLDVIEGEEIIKDEKQILHNTSHLRAKKMKQLIEDHLLLHNDKVIFTPHIAFYSKESIERILNTTIENIESFVNKKIINKIN